MPDVILVDFQDNPIGVMEKMMAHQTGKLHRAFSVFVFNDHEELLLHRRALTKYHSPGLWTNTCCSHPMPGEDVVVARRNGHGLYPGEVI
jgi:isopentenyl-diphosphate delta-isomerase